MTSLCALEPFVRRARRRDEREEPPRCELCGARLVSAHRHVVNRADRSLVCACVACASAFDGGSPSGTFITVPGRAVAAREPAVGPAELDPLGVPVSLAFFFRSSATGRVLAVFPSAAGSTEAEVPDAAWSALSDKSARVRGLAADVEALLVRRERGGRCDAYVVPVDVCYELTGIVRRRWRGVAGGDEVHAELDAFFAALDGSRGAA